MIMNNVNEYPHQNIAYLCTDWQIERGLGESVALKWISATQELREFTFQDLANLSNRAANVLVEHGLVQGDRMMILLPKKPELFAYFLGALKAGINCSILFSSIGEDTLIDRVIETNTKLLVTNSSFYFRIRRILPSMGQDFKILMIDENTGTGNVTGVLDEFSQASEKFKTVSTEDDQPSHFHFTSGSTGKPKGVQHRHTAVENHLASFNEIMQPDDETIYWCTADPGWVTGVTYGIIAPWIRGITQIHVEGNYNP